MRDYFAEFLLNPRASVSKFGTAPSDGGAPATTTTPSEAFPLKYKIACGLGAVVVGVVSWHLSKWYTIIKSATK